MMIITHSKLKINVGGFILPTTSKTKAIKCPGWVRKVPLYIYIYTRSE